MNSQRKKSVNDTSYKSPATNCKPPSNLGRSSSNLRSSKSNKDLSKNKKRNVVQVKLTEDEIKNDMVNAF